MATKLDHIYGVGGQVGNLSNRVTTLETNAAKKNEANTFTQSQTINGHIQTNNGLRSDNANPTLTTIVNQGEKNLNILFEQPNAGFRNFCHINFNVKEGSSGTPATILKLSSKGGNDKGLFITTEENKLKFENPTTISNGLVPTPTMDNGIANKTYVDNANPFRRIVNHTNTLAANAILEWSVGNNLVNERLHSFIIKCAVSGTDYVFNVTGWIQSRDYKNMFPTLSFSSANNFTETAKIKFWVDNNKVKLFSSVALSNCSIYLKVEKHT